MPDSTLACQPPSPARTRVQRVRVPWRLVAEPHYADVALSVYVKVAALAARPEGCQARTATIAAYLGMSKSSVERGLTQLGRPAPDGVTELISRRRSLPGGTGTSALRRVRPLRPGEQFVWLPVAAAEDLTPRQLCAYAVIMWSEVRNIPLSEAELAGYLRHYSGSSAGQPLTEAAAGEVIDSLEATGWITVHRRAGSQGRHRFIPHTPQDLVRPQLPCENTSDEGSGPRSDEGSLANKESLRTDRPENKIPFQPAVGASPLLARARRPDGRDATASSANTPQPKAGSRSEHAFTPRVHDVLEPVRVLVGQLRSAWVSQRLETEVERLLDAGTEPERLRHRLTARFAATLVEEIRDPGRWLIGVGLPRWGCGIEDCESGVLWRTGRPCEVCRDLRADRRAPDPGPAPRPAPRHVPRQAAWPEPRKRGNCRECGCRILLTAKALTDSLCKPCREESAPPPPLPAAKRLSHVAIGDACART